MSEFKVGDKVRKVTSKHLWSFNKGEELTVTGFSSLGNAWVSNGERKDTAYDSDLELIEPSPNTPKTYTLTPYIKPETVTIKGVEYIMTENV